MYARHDRVVEEMRQRGFSHESPLDESKATGTSEQRDGVDTIAEQKRLLSAKDCGCLIDAERTE